MAKQIIANYNKKPKVKRKGVHSKTKQSKIKSSKRYKKQYRGQGR